MKVHLKSKKLLFKKPSGTSRGILVEKPTWYVILEQNGNFGIGECSILKGLSIDDRPDFEKMLGELALKFTAGDDIEKQLKNWPSIRFGLEMAKLDLVNGGQRMIFDNSFSKGLSGIPINGLVWMGDKEYMKSQIDDLLNRGFQCIKMKIGAINFEEEMELLNMIRKRYPAKDLVLRVDANGAFSTADALEKLKKLSELEMHSIEQPIKAGNIEAMAKLCEESPLDIALDEELIPILASSEKQELLAQIRPQYIILKPSLVGGFAASEEWIDIANSFGINWWATSALESNIGLNAISQWTDYMKVEGHQGLGTGSLYVNNIESPLEIRGEQIFYNPAKDWNLDELF